VTKEQYQRWLNSSATKEVFALLEQAARPATLKQGLTEPDASYALGFITGFWEALDTARNLVVEAPEAPTETYQGDV